MRRPMYVFLTFDIEIWCNDWNALDARFPAAFDRYVYGRSASGDYALPKTLEILDRYGLKGVFFVEPLFAARFGERHLGTVTRLITDAGQEVQLHLHPEWADEIRPAVFPDKPYKRQHLFQYSRDEQATPIRLGLSLLESVGCSGISAFRAGSFAANRDTLAAVAACDLAVDSSLNMTCAISGGDLRDDREFYLPSALASLQLVPISVFRDGFGHERHAQVGACSAAELTAAIEHAAALGQPCFTILSHNFEMLRSGSSRHDPVVATRFEALCRFLAATRERFPTRGFVELPRLPSPAEVVPLACSGRLPTLRRYAEQGLRRLIA